MFEAHCAPTVHAALSGEAQVFAAGLQMPVMQALLVPALLHVSWRPSAGSEEPPASLSVHVNVLRAQKRPEGQSVSTKHEDRFGTHAPDAEQVFEVHCAPLVHAVPLAAEQVLREGLHAPVTQTAAAFAAVQVPSWRPSFGIAAPAASFVMQVNVLRSQ